MNAVVKSIQKELVENKNFPSFKAGDTVTAYYEIREGEKIRTQFFKGVVIQIKGEGLNKTFTIRKMSGTIGVERIFPIFSPKISGITVLKRGKVRRAKLYYLRDRRGKSARIVEKIQVAKKDNNSKVVKSEVEETSDEKTS